MVGCLTLSRQHLLDETVIIFVTLTGIFFGIITAQRVASSRGTNRWLLSKMER